MPDGTRHFRVRNFERFQHYKERLPPWIKLHYTILDNYQIYSLDDATKWHIVAIWLLASRHNNRLPFDPAWIGHRINAQTPVDLDRLVTLDMIEEIDDSIMLASRTQGGLSETEAEAEAEADPLKPPQGARFEEWWHVYPKKVKKIPALKKWKAKRLDRMADALIADTKKRQQTDGRWIAGYIPDPTTYITQERWNDDFEPVDERRDRRLKEEQDSRLARDEALSPLERVNRAAQERRDRRELERSGDGSGHGGSVEGDVDDLRKPVDIMARRSR